MRCFTFNVQIIYVHGEVRTKQMSAHLCCPYGGVLLVDLVAPFITYKSIRCNFFSADLHRTYIRGTQYLIPRYFILVLNFFFTNTLLRKIRIKTWINQQLLLTVLVTTYPRIFRYTESSHLYLYGWPTASAHTWVNTSRVLPSGPQKQEVQQSGKLPMSGEKGGGDGGVEKDRDVSPKE